MAEERRGGHGNGSENGRTPVLRNEDWWSCFLGWLLVGLAVPAVLPMPAKLGKWTFSDLSGLFPQGLDALWATLLVFAVAGVLTLLGGLFLKFDRKRYLAGFGVVFGLAFLAEVVGHHAYIKDQLQLSPVIFCLAFGLLISNFFRVPPFLAAGRQTEFFVKIGLVCMGAGILFIDVVRAGAVGLVQAVLVATAVWFMTYWICRGFRVSERFSAIIATANSICGVSASIAAGGAIQGKPKEVAYVVAWVLVCAVVLIAVLPPIAVALGLTPAWAGAWVGGVIDNTGAVIAAGGVIDRMGEGAGAVAEKAAAMVKMAQNVLIGLAAFLLAIWATMSLERKEAGEGFERPSFGEVVYRFPKFVVGFLVASVIVSFLVEPILGLEHAKYVGEKACKAYRNLFFNLCFVSIGLETNFRELVSVGGGRPAIAYWLSQSANALWTLFITWLLWSGVLFAPVL